MSSRRSISQSSVRSFKEESKESSMEETHASKVLSNLKRMKEEKIACDFEIRVNGRIISVHRAVIIANSTYFEGQFSRNIREVQDGYIEMNEMTVEGIECCVKFMYTGKVSVTFLNVRCVLKPAHLMQINDLVKICLQCLRDNLNTETCLMVSKLLQLYGSSNEQSIADTCVEQNFGEVTKTDEFLELDKDDFMRLSKTLKLEPDAHWKGIVTWINGDVERRQEFLRDAVKLLINEGEISLRFLIENIWEHPLMQSNNLAKRCILECLLAGPDNFKRDMDMDLKLCFALRKITVMNDSAESDQLSETLITYLADNFKQATKNEEFLELSHKDLTAAICRSGEPSCNAEIMKWEIMLKWVKYNEKQRMEKVPDLMKLLVFKKLPAGYVLRNIRNEPLVAQSPICNDILRKAAYFCIAPDTIVMLDAGTRVLTTFDIESGHQSEITTFNERDFLKVISLQGQLYSLQNEELYKYLKTGFWKRQAVMHKKPNRDAKAITFQDSIYVVEKSTMARYSPSKNIWIEGLPGCGLNQGFCVTSSENFIYAIGGFWTWHSAKRFELQSGNWMNMALPVEGRRGAAAVTYKGKLYVLGGSASGTNKSHVECYDEHNNEWSTQANMGRPRAWFSATVHNECLYVMGGCLAKNSVEAYFPDFDRWENKGEIAPPAGSISVCICTL